MSAPYLRCPQGHRPLAGHGPFQGLTGLKCQSKSLALQRALTDFGAEKSFEQAGRQLKGRYGVELHRSSIREVMLKQAEKAAGFVCREEQEAIASYEKQRSHRLGQSWLIVETDGCMVRTGELERDPAGGMSLGGRPKRTRRTQWREVRLSLVEAPGGKGAAIRCGVGFSSEGRRADVCLGAKVRVWGQHLGA